MNTELLKVFPLCVLPVCTVPPGPVTVSENNTADVQLVEITSGVDVTLTVTINPDSLFYLKGNALMVKKGLDYEASPGIFPKHQSIYLFERRRESKAGFPVPPARLASRLKSHIVESVHQGSQLVLAVRWWQLRLLKILHTNLHHSET